MSSLVTKKIIPQDAEGHINIITICGDISAEKQVAFFDNFNKAPDFPFLVYIESLGGSSNTGVAIMDALSSLVRPVTFISKARCSSMGAIIPHIDESIRLSYASTIFMYHEAKYSASGSYELLEQKLSVQLEHTAEVDELVMKSIGLTKVQYKKYSGRDVWLDTKTALEVGKHGMIDGIVLKDYRDGRFLIKTREGNKEIDITKHRRSDLKNLPIVKG